MEPPDTWALCLPAYFFYCTVAGWEKNGTMTLSSKKQKYPDMSFVVTVLKGEKLLELCPTMNEQFFVVGWSLQGF